ncbi:Clavaminate synthase-like protein [Mollisia scopiformis]|uniref:Clavaminate synthase-like protein n=1 Tax=Mollisia scopiformis TaxID=149040 RepID=A0A132BCK6_MOLSC|nr:Clavaminate synthase-like protein [Mollisia scopiformis]KUJ09983.1 Clavaminate synthase-like protein [Mollisia scopiformis]
MTVTNGTSGLIPVIDISGSLPQKEVAKQLVDAAATYGFVYIKNLGKDIPIEAIDSIFDLSKEFFTSPLEVKQPCKIQENNRGWVGMHAETLDTKNQKRGDFKEAMNLGEFVDGKAQQPLPPSFAAREAEIDQFQKYCHGLMIKILVLFAIGLEVDPSSGGPDWFSSRHIGAGPSPCTLRLLHYPPLPPDSDFHPSVDIRAGAHTDYGSITLLFQRPGQPGLEIIPPSSMDSHNYTNTASWTPVPVSPPTTTTDPSPPILVNIGDLLSYWTNNLFKSTVHRVIFPSTSSTYSSPATDRYSIAYFGHPLGSTVLEPVPSERVQELAGKGEQKTVEGMTAEEHLMSRLRATYLGMYRDGEGKEEVREVVASA